MILIHNMVIYCIFIFLSDYLHLVWQYYDWMWMEAEVQFVCTLKLKDDGRKTGATYNTVSFSDCVSASKSKRKDFLLTHYFWGTIIKRTEK